MTGIFFVPLDIDGNPVEIDLEEARKAIKLKGLIVAYLKDEINDYAVEFAKLKFTGENPFIEKEAG